MLKKKIKIRDWSVQERPREKLIVKGRNSLSDAELLAILLRSGSRTNSALDLARSILSSIEGDLAKLARLNVEQLSKFDGMGSVKALTVISAMELGRRRMSQKPSQKTEISGSESAFQHLYPFLSDLEHEEFWVIHLNRANHVLATERISSGGISGTVVDIRLLMKSCIEKLSSSIILAHNHPSGNLKASKTDIGLTFRVVEAGEILDVKILDHLILGENAYLSFLDEGIL